MPSLSDLAGGGGGQPEIAFDRAAKVNVYGHELSYSGGKGFSIAFSVKRNRKEEEPGTFELTLYNLSENTRNEISSAYDEAREKAKEILKEQDPEKRQEKLSKEVPPKRVTIAAGYINGSESVELPILAEMDITELSHTYQGVEWITKIKGQDRFVPWRTQSPGAKQEPTKGNVFASIAKAFAVRDGISVPEAQEKYLKDLTEKEVNHGWFDIASAPERLDNAIASFKLQRIDGNGVVRAINFGPIPDNATPVVLSPTTGLLGRPVYRPESKQQNVHTLLSPLLEPRREVELKNAAGDSIGADKYQVDAVEHRGSTFGNDWYSYIVLSEPEG